VGQILHQLNEDNLTFPSLNHALTDPNGLLAIGGDLTPQRLINAYHQGIFPWFNQEEPIMWWSPNPRAVIKFDHLRINKTLRKAIKKCPFKITINHAFEQVIQHCANAPFRHDDTWIIPTMQHAYIELHKRGYAHSIEVWQEEPCVQNNADIEYELVGGLYGVAINGCFSGESMFYTKANASKFALVALVKALESININFIDCQLLNPFLESMGSTEISREQFILLKDIAINTHVHKDFWTKRELFI